jgi:hypothetical protein
VTAVEASARRRYLDAVMVVALLVLSACSAAGGDSVASAGGKADTTVNDTEQETLDEEAQALAFAACMRDNGVDMPDPEPGQEGLFGAFHGLEQEHDRDTIEQALAACEDLLPRRAHGDEHDLDDEAMLELAECLREQGIEVPDNIFEGGALHGEEEDEARAAMEVCRDKVVEGDK